MGGVCQDPEGQYFVWRSTLSLTIQACLVYYSNCTGDVTINYLELKALLMQLLFFAPRMNPLAHIQKYINNTAAHGWSNRGSVRKVSSVGPILQELSLSDRRKHIHTSVGRVPREDKNMSEAASRLTHLPDSQFLSHFRTHLPAS